MSGERYLIQAIQSRFVTDSTLIGYCNGGCWFGAIPDMNDVAGWTFSGGTAVLSGATVAQPTWIEYRVALGGEIHTATGGRWNDVSVRVECHSLESLLKAINASERVEDLLVGWTPTITNWPGAWKVLRTGGERDGGRAPPPVSQPRWRAIGLYEFQYGT
jgi:hypothetical protein